MGEPELVWRVPRACEAAASCVEVACDGDRVIIRGTAPDQRPGIRLTRREWRAFVDAIKRGGYDS